MKACLTHERVFSLVVDKLEAKLRENNFETKSEKDNNEIKEIYTKGDLYYEVSYSFLSKIFVLKNNEKVISSWYFDSGNNIEKQAKGIALDFLESMEISDSSKIKKQLKPKKKKTENSETDPIFLINRIASIFPELKEEIQKEREVYERFRPVTFAKKIIVPKIQEFLDNKPDETRLKKLGLILSSLYENGNFDTRSIINVVIVSGLENSDSLKKNLDDNFKKATLAVEKVKDKNIAPEKPKKSSFLERNLVEFNK